MNGPALSPGTVPVGPLLSMYDPIFIGVDEFGAPVYTKLIYRNLLAAGEPGGGKSGLLNTFAAHAALSIRNRNVLFDGKQVELGMWDDLADEFVGPDLDHAIITLRRLQKVMDNRYTWLRAHRRRKIEPTDDVGCPAFSGQMNWCYFMPLPADSGTRPEPLAESGTRVPSGDESDCTGAQCTAQYLPSLSSALGRRSG